MSNQAPFEEFLQQWIEEQVSHACGTIQNTDNHIIAASKPGCDGFEEDWRDSTAGLIEQISRDWNLTYTLHTCGPYGFMLQLERPDEVSLNGRFQRP